LAGDRIQAKRKAGRTRLPALGHQVDEHYEHEGDHRQVAGEVHAEPDGNKGAEEDGDQTEHRRHDKTREVDQNRCRNERAIPAMNPLVLNLRRGWITVNCARRYAATLRETRLGASPEVAPSGR
jgi:hypothetical protein